MEESQASVEKQEDFADFSRFESFVEAQGEVRRASSPRPAQHRRSFSLDSVRLLGMIQFFFLLILD